MDCEVCGDTGFINHGSDFESTCRCRDYEPLDCEWCGWEPSIAWERDRIPHTCRTIDLMKRIEQLEAQRDWMVDVHIERWHSHRYPPGLELHEWLEWSWDQYGSWLMDRSDFPPVPDARK